jgi:hypothetical protein
MREYKGEIVEGKGVEVRGVVEKKPGPVASAAAQDVLFARACSGRTNAAAHARLLNRMTDGHPLRARHSVLHLQRTYGNQYVKRVLGVATKGEVEVTPEVEATIEHSRGGGQSLDTGVRRHMESAFGNDFSGVRIHTDSQSHSLNRAVNAIAFATGQDIFFRDGAYNPESSGGKELLAHELTHVVQQNGAAPISGKAQRFQIQRMCAECEEEKKNIQGKLTVGQPNDQYEQEADGVSNEVSSAPDAIQRQSNPQPSPQTTGAPPALGAAQPAAPAKAGATPAPAGACPTGTETFLESFKDNLGTPLGSVSLDAETQLLGSTNQLMGTEKFPKGSQEFSAFQLTQQDKTFHGTVRLNLSACWKFRGDNTGTALLVSEVPFRILPASAKGSDDTIVKNKAPRIVTQTTAGVGAALDSAPQLLADTDDTGLSLTASPRITFQEQIAKQIGATIGIGSLQFQTQTAQTVAYGTSCTVDLSVNPAPPPPSPKTYDCQECFGPFVVASDRFIHEDDSLQKIHDWYFGLDPNVRQDLEQGQGLLKLTGRASTTGTKAFDLSLAEKRAKRVARVIADFAGSNAHLNSFALGAFAAQTQGEVASERRVDVEASGHVAAMQGTGCPTPLCPSIATAPTGPQPPAPSSGGGAGGAVPASTGNAGAVSGGGGSQEFENSQSDLSNSTQVSEAQSTQEIATSGEDQSVTAGESVGPQSEGRDVKEG